MTVDVDLSQALDVLAPTPAQRRELLADPERAAGWVAWARHHGKGIAAVLAQHRTGQTAPDISAWYAEDGTREKTAKSGPDHSTLLRCAEGLVRNTGHELLAADVDDELDRLARHPKIGNGAQLSAVERERLHGIAAGLRARHEAGQEQRDREDAEQAAGYYRRLALTSKQAADVRARLTAAGRADLAAVVSARPGKE